MTRSDRITELLAFIEDQDPELTEYELINAYSYKSGVSTRTVRDYVKVLLGAKKIQSCQVPGYGLPVIRLVD